MCLTLGSPSGLAVWPKPDFPRMQAFCTCQSLSPPAIVVPQVGDGNFVPTRKAAFPRASFCSVGLSTCAARLLWRHQLHQCKGHRCRRRASDSGSLSWLPKFEVYFPWPNFGPPEPPACAKKLRDLLIAAEANGFDAGIRKTVDECIAELRQARVQCRAELLGSSTLQEDLWRMAYIQGRTPGWEANAQLLRPLFRNKAGQAFDSGAGRVMNYGEVVGSGVYFTAEGSFEAVDRAEDCPKDFAVQVERGGLVILGLPLLSSAISGPGLVRVLYLDRDIRIFETAADSPDRWEQAGVRVVQVRDQLFSAEG